MAIGAPSSTGSQVEVSGTPISSPMSVTVTITAGETGVAVIHFGAVGGAVSSITGGGTWTKICEITNNGLAAYHSELWATDPGAATSSASFRVDRVDRFPRSDRGVDRIVSWHPRVGK
jgi:hypothetical protein